MDAPTWIIHAVGDECSCEGCKGTDTGRPLVFHTHGIAEFNDGLELELNIQCSQDGASWVINTLGDALRNKVVSLEDALEETTLFAMPLRFVKVEQIDSDDGGEILRIIIPDKAGLFPEDEGCDPFYAAQLLPGERLTDTEYHDNFEIALDAVIGNILEKEKGN